MIKLGTGNLLNAPVEALVNTVNTVGVMGKGIALQFSRAYPDMLAKYEEDSKAGRVRLGRMNVFDLGGLVGETRYIINFPTKGHWRAKSRLSDIAAGLEDLVQVVRTHKIRSIAVPPLGCGHGGLDWADVRLLIERALGQLSGVDVLLFEPKGAPSAEGMPQRTARPKMTTGRAVLIKLIAQFQKGLVDPFVTLLVVQKLMYFLQEAGEPLKLNFVTGKYGPYADNLRHQLNAMEGHYTIGCGDGSDAPHKMLDLRDGALEEADEYLARRDDTARRLDRVARLIHGFEDHYGMELLATVHWVMQQSPDAREKLDTAIELVQSWNVRKRITMTPAQIEAAWTRLVKEDWQFDCTGIAGNQPLVAVEQQFGA